LQENRRIDVLCTQGGRWSARKQGREQEVGAFRVEEGGEVGEGLGGGYAERDDRNGETGPGGFGLLGFGRSGKVWEISAVGCEDNVVEREESDSAPRCSAGLSGIDGKHMGWHVWGDIVDKYTKFFRQNVFDWVGLDISKNLEHSGGKISGDSRRWLGVAYLGPRTSKPSRI
jgi:hypothetical protein